MLQITCNGKPLTVPEGALLQQTAHQQLPTASVVILNGFQTGEEQPLRDGDSITVIKVPGLGCWRADKIAISELGGLLGITEEE